MVHNWIWRTAYAYPNQKSSVAHNGSFQRHFRDYKGSPYEDAKELNPVCLGESQKSYLLGLMEVFFASDLTDGGNMLPRKEHSCPDRSAAEFCLFLFGSCFRIMIVLKHCYQRTTSTAAPT
ncbi:hypothetical protein AVEN_99853-1 [Araneus ventricosus]|uniref:Uncharacterized protein n=1 Tax=Araneus ventricosus TaxID=182803 RepID=A0A4Y2MGW8_ARAVE|nr:hypothetical protein AVEN_99853-1 [Araneus ventricosus]